MTIIECILDIRVRNHQQRIERMKFLSVPQIVMEREQELLQKALNKDVTIKNSETLGCLEYVSVVAKIESGGKNYLHFECINGQKVNYFPQAKYGPCLFPAKEGV